jgi:hypothetical protein
MKTTKRIASQADATGERQLAGFIKKFDSKNAALIRSVRKVLRERLPTANELVYDNYNFFVIGYSSTERPSDCVLSMPQARMELGCRSTTEPRSPILISCSSAAGAKTVLSGSSPRRRWRVQRLRNLSLLPSRRLKGRCLGAAEASWSFDPSRKNRSHAVKPRISTILGKSSATLT